ncbi:MAG: sigma-70 family RNA polymerase sigma factor [Candidatus Latescibacterota bacterium]
MRAGDLQAFEDIVRRYWTMVHATARQHASPLMDAEDVVQQVFLTAYVGMHGLRDPSRLPAWLSSIARFTCSKRRRGRLAQRVPLDDEDLAGALTDGESDRPDVLLERGELRERIQQALASLPPSTGEVVTLQFMDGLSYEDIAASLAVPTFTVKGRLQTGRGRLRKELRDMVQDHTTRDLLERAAAAARPAGRGTVWEPNLDEALALVEQALAHATMLPTARQRDTARLHALMAKAEYQPRSHAAVRQQLNEEALQLARKLKEHAAIGGLLAERADWSSGKERIRTLDEAAGAFRAAGEPEREGQAPLFKASWMPLGGQLAEAEPLFRRARELVAGVGARGHAWAAVCDAALQFLPSIGRDRGPGTWHEYGWVAEVLRREPDGSVTYLSQPGFGGGRLYGHLIYDAATMRVLVDGRRRVGERWSADTFSYGARPLRTTATVVSDDEEVRVPAGTFRGCRLIRMETTDPAPREATAPQARSTNRFQIGTRAVWYARGVGLVRVRVDTERTRDQPVAFVLQEVDVKEPGDEWLRLALGNRWVYAREEKLNQEYCGAHALEVRYADAGTYYLSHCTYGYAVGAAGEQEVRREALFPDAQRAAIDHRWADAISGLEQLLAEGHEAWAATLLGRVLWRTGQYARAVAVLVRVPQIAPAQICLARCYDLLGRRDEALQVYRHVLELSPQESIEAAARAGLEEPHQAHKRPGVAPAPGERELPPDGWSATAHPHGKLAHLTFDRDTETRWFAVDDAQSPGMYFLLDLGAVRLVSRIVLDDDASGNTIYIADYPRQYKVEVSTDGAAWELVASAAGDPRWYAGASFAVRNVRFIRIEQTGSVRPESWSIYEIHVFGPQDGGEPARVA